MDLVCVILQPISRFLFHFISLKLDKIVSYQAPAKSRSKPKVKCLECDYVWAYFVSWGQSREYWERALYWSEMNAIIFDWAKMKQPYFYFVIQYKDRSPQLVRFNAAFFRGINNVVFRSREAGSTWTLKVKMVQCSTGIIRIGLLVLLAWPSYSATATFTLEELHEQFQGLRENYVS